MKLSDLYWFIITFMIVYLYYLLRYIIGKKKKYDVNRVPQELLYLIYKYRLDMSKIKYKKIMNQIGIVCAFDMAFTSTFIFKFIKNIYVGMLIGAVVLFLLIYITFGYIGKYYKKKGLIKNGNIKD